MMYHINSFTFIELSFNIKQRLIHGLPFADLVDEPTVLFVFSILKKSTDVFTA